MIGKKHQNAVILRVFEEISEEQYKTKGIDKRQTKGSVYQSLSHVPLFATLWTVVFQALLSMGFSRQGYWSELPSRDLPNPGIYC